MVSVMSMRMKKFTSAAILCFVFLKFVDVDIKYQLSLPLKRSMKILVRTMTKMNRMTATMLA